MTSRKCEAGVSGGWSGVPWSQDAEQDRRARSRTQEASGDQEASRGGPGGQGTLLVYTVLLPLLTWVLGTHQTDAPVFRGHAAQRASDCHSQPCKREPPFLGNYKRVPTKARGPAVGVSLPFHKITRKWLRRWT